MTVLHLKFTSNITSASAESRTITGQIVPFGKIGSTSAGKVIFEAGSIKDVNPENIKLLLEHNSQKPIGRGMTFSVNPSGIFMSFKVSNTTSGTDRLVEAADGLRDGLSIGARVDKYTMKDGVMLVSNATLEEVSLVSSPAFIDARVLEVAASETEAPEAPEIPETSESEIADLETTEKIEEAIVENETANAEVVASAAVQASAPIFTSPRSPIVDGASYLEHSIKAARGNDDSRIYVAAADDTLSTNPAFNPTEYLSGFVGSAQRKFGRPTIDACGGATSHQFIGNTVSIPRVVNVPTVASTAEGVAPSETGITSSYLSGTATKYAGMNTFSVELLDLQGSPTFYAELMNEMAAAYAKATNAAVVAAIVAGGTLATVTAATAAGVQAFVAKEAPAAYAATGEFANAYVAGAGQWELLLGATGSDGRNLFNAYVPQNASGVVSAGSSRGTVLGVDLYVDNAMVATNIDDSAFLIAGDSIGIYEQAPRLLQVNQINSLQIEVSMHGYLATIIKRAGGLRRFNVA